jgi:hypothetical protein
MELTNKRILHGLRDNGQGFANIRMKRNGVFNQDGFERCSCQA